MQGREAFRVEREHGRRVAVRHRTLRGLDVALPEYYVALVFVDEFAQLGLEFVGWIYAYLGGNASVSGFIKIGVVKVVCKFFF